MLLHIIPFNAIFYTENNESPNLPFSQATASQLVNIVEAVAVVSAISKSMKWNKKNAYGHSE